MTYPTTLTGQTLTVLEVQIEAFARIHIGLIDLGRATARAYGGCGFAISRRVIAVTARHAETPTLRGLEALDDRGRHDVAEALARLEVAVNQQLSLELVINADVPQHVGLGTKTALLLAVLDAVNRLLLLDLSHAELASLSGRGGTSGIGIRTFFDGGFIADAGHPQDSVQILKPSSRGNPATPPPLVARHDFPVEWCVWLLRPADGKRIAGADEAEFFAHATPVSVQEVYQTLSAVYHGVVPAIAKTDLDLLRTSLSALHASGFKARELSAQAHAVTKVLRACWAEGLAAGLSSLGPTVYVVTPCDAETNRLRAIAESHSVVVEGPLKPQNGGARITVDEAA